MDIKSGRQWTGTAPGSGSSSNCSQLCGLAGELPLLVQARVAVTSNGYFWLGGCAPIRGRKQEIATSESAAISCVNSHILITFD